MPENPPSTRKTAIIIGAGPAGLTAAYELLTRTEVLPIVLEKSDMMGGLSRTVNYKGNRIDIGGHRFFSKSDRVMQWWLARLPMQQVEANGSRQLISYRKMSREVTSEPAAPDPATTDRVMLLRSRRSRIYYLRKFFDYPISLNRRTFANLGFVRMVRIGLSYLASAIRPIRQEKTLEDFFTNRFGRELYRTFFQSYTEKVWGVPCDRISAAWGAQRVKGLSIWKTLLHAIRTMLPSLQDPAQKSTETSLIEQFLYPKFGPGQMWEEVAREVTARGGQIITNHDVVNLCHDGKRLTSVTARDTTTGARSTYPCDFVFSTMPILELARAMDPPPPPPVVEVAEGLVYRDFITVGLLLSELKLKEDSVSGARLLRDNWIYIQEPDVKVGRLQIFNNWSPYMVADPTKAWIGLEYFCNVTDDLWQMPDPQMIDLAKKELQRIGFIDPANVLDAVVIRMEKTYPAYFGTYHRFGVIREYADSFENLLLVGRNGMHKYNNQDHSMLTAMIAVDNIVAGRTDKRNLWEVNTEEDYHEETNEAATAK